MKKCFNKFVIVATLFTLIMGAVSCSNDEPIVRVINDVPSITDIDVVNVTKSDTLNVSGAIHIGLAPELQIKNGDYVSINFLPAEKYQKFHFVTTYYLQDSIEVKNHYAYDYILKNAKVGKDTISMSAQYKDSIYQIGATGTVVLVVTE